LVERAAATAAETADASAAFNADVTGAGVGAFIGATSVPCSITAIVVPGVSSELRECLPVGIVAADTIVGDRNFALCDGPLWNMATIASKLHLAWIGAACGRLGTGCRHSDTLGWNSFPAPRLTAKNRADPTTCAENILLAREFHPHFHSETQRQAVSAAERVAETA